MRHSDFRIGEVFYAAAGHPWRCTDVGTRTICAISLMDHADDPSWFNGPPYAVQEMVFDEYDFDGCYNDMPSMIMDRVSDIEESAHPGFDVDDVSKMIRTMMKFGGKNQYPRRAMLRRDRIGENGEIFHPYAVKKTKKGKWKIFVFEIFSRNYSVMSETSFRDLPIATNQDMLKRMESFRE